MPTTKLGLTNCRRNHEENVTALEFAGDAIKKAQVQQKQQQDAFAHSATLVEGERVIVYIHACQVWHGIQIWQGHTIVHTVWFK